MQRAAFQSMAYGNLMQSTQLRPIIVFSGCFFDTASIHKSQQAQTSAPIQELERNKVKESKTTETSEAPQQSQERKDQSPEEPNSEARRSTHELDHTQAPQKGIVHLGGSARRATYWIEASVQATQSNIHKKATAWCEAIKTVLTTTESEAHASSCLLTFERFLLFIGGSELETSINGEAVAKYIQALYKVERGEIKLSVATIRNVAVALATIFQALLTLSKPPSGTQAALLVAKRSSKRTSSQVNKRRAEELTVAAAEVLNVDFDELRNTIRPILVDMEREITRDWSKATGAIVSALYVYGLTSRPHALTLLTVEDGLKIAEGESVVRGEMKNRSDKVATVFLLNHSLPRQAILSYCSGRSLNAALFAKSRDSENSYAHPASLMTKLFDKLLGKKRITTTILRKAVETLAGRALSRGNITEAERATVAEAEDHTLNVARTIYETDKKIVKEKQALRVFDKITGLKDAGKDDDTTPAQRKSKRRRKAVDYSHDGLGNSDVSK